MTTMTQDRAAAIATFYAEHAAAIERIVASRVNGASAEMIEDACHIAWVTLLRRPDVRLGDDGVGWLIVVASHEGWRLASRARETPVGVFMSAPADEDREAGVLPEPAGDASDPADRALDGERHRDRVARFAALKPAEREALLLNAAGYSYADLGRLLGVSYTAVNRRLAEGRARLRPVERARPRACDNPSPDGA